MFFQNWKNNNEILIELRKVQNSQTNPEQNVEENKAEDILIPTFKANCKAVTKIVWDCFLAIWLRSNRVSVLISLKQ